MEVEVKKSGKGRVIGGEGEGFADSYTEDEDTEIE